MTPMVVARRGGGVTRFLDDFVGFRGLWPDNPRMGVEAVV